MERNDLLISSGTLRPDQQLEQNMLADIPGITDWQYLVCRRVGSLTKNDANSDDDMRPYVIIEASHTGEKVVDFGWFSDLPTKAGYFFSYRHLAGRVIDQQNLLASYAVTGRIGKDLGNGAIEGLRFLQSESGEQ